MSNQEELKKEFPYAMNNVYCGVCHPTGWNEIVREAVAVLDKCKARVSQTKIKFGGLRIYFDFDDWENTPSDVATQCDNAVREAEIKAWKTCEVCGKTATKKASGWNGPSCDDHSE